MNPLEQFLRARCLPTAMGLEVTMRFSIFKGAERIRLKEGDEIVMEAGRLHITFKNGMGRPEEMSFMDYAMQQNSAKKISIRFIRLTEITRIRDNNQDVRF
jgi:hypothetical protein